jgi:hypothetical protein
MPRSGQVEPVLAYTAPSHPLPHLRFVEPSPEAALEPNAVRLSPTQRA